MFQLIQTQEEYQQAIDKNTSALIYFSHEQCNVCRVLKPKIEELITNLYPEIKLYYCDTIKNPEIAAQIQIFAVPTIIVFFEGKEYLRKSRNIGIDQLSDEISRPYQMLLKQ
jgi:thioredoxin-like negative regulator of GroEL